ncbi:MAG: DeoR family transcriptional regulator [Candidatus Paceibacterota bacterium]|jgi:hypothetical protein
MDYKNNNNQGNVMSHRQANSTGAFSIMLPKKCERLATAIYLVTNFLSDTEPMKSRLRALSLDFVRDASVLKNGSYGVEANVLEALRSNILETLSLLELAFVAGLVSEMNFTILKREYASLRDTIEIKKASRESRTDNVLGDNFFGSAFHQEENISTPVSRPVIADLAKSRRAVSIEARPKQSSMSDMQPRALSKGHSIGHKTTTPAPIPNPKFNIQNSAPARALTDIQKEGRRARILKLVKDNREVTIKDIANHFPDLSEKTIQRELVTLVESNVLKKFGERRWSKYTLM